MATGSTSNAGGHAAADSLDVELLQSISLAVAKVRDVETVLKMIVMGLADKASC